MRETEEVKTKSHCFHCGEICNDEVVHEHDKEFCCVGCATVYSMLSDSGLSDYYDINLSPGARVVSDEALYKVLDNDNIEHDLLQYFDSNIKKVRLTIPTIHCSSCIFLLENLPKIYVPARQSRVSFLKREVDIVFDSNTGLKELVLFLAKIGYPPEITLANSEGTKKDKKDSGLIRKIAISGFCFGNSMLISIPHYLDVSLSIDEEFRHFFGYFNALLALPVLVFGAQDYIKSAFTSLKHRHINIDVPIALGIIILFSRSFFEVVSDAGVGYFDSFCGLIFFLLLGKWFQSKSYQALSFDRDYSSYFPLGVSKLTKENAEQVIPVRDVVAGDRLLVHNQEVIPVDSELVEGVANINYSFVTGESTPSIAIEGERIFAGGRHMGSPIQIKALKRVDESYLVGLWNQESFHEDKSSNLVTIVDKVSSYFTAIILLVAFGSGVYWFMNDTELVWEVVSEVLIVACPCALALALPFAYGHAIRIFGKYGLYLRCANVVEQMRGIQEVVFDKTGTLTQSGVSEVSYQGGELSKQDLSVIYHLIKNSFHPHSRSILGHFENKNYSLDKTIEVKGFNEVAGKGLIGYLEEIEYRLGSSDWVGASMEQYQQGVVYLKVRDEIKGKFLLRSQYRNGFENTLKKMNERFGLNLLSGDHAGERSRLASYFENLHFNLKPHDKLKYVKDSIVSSSKVAMIGDGLNDAGALKESNFGVAISDDLRQFSPSCDAILEGKSFSLLPYFFDFSGKITKVLYAAFALSFVYNIVGLSLAVTGVLTPVAAAILMPLSSVSVVGFVTMMAGVLERKVFAK